MLGYKGTLNRKWGTAFLASYDTLTTAFSDSLSHLIPSLYWSECLLLTFLVGQRITGTISWKYTYTYGTRRHSSIAQLQCAQSVVRYAHKLGNTLPGYRTHANSHESKAWFSLWNVISILTSTDQLLLLCWELCVASVWSG